MLTYGCSAHTSARPGPYCALRTLPSPARSVFTELGCHLGTNIWTNMATARSHPGWGNSEQHHHGECGPEQCNVNVIIINKIWAHILTVSIPSTCRNSCSGLAVKVTPLITIVGKTCPYLRLDLYSLHISTISPPAPHYCPTRNQQTSARPSLWSTLTTI